MPHTTDLYQCTLHWIVMASLHIQPTGACSILVRWLFWYKLQNNFTVCIQFNHKRTGFTSSVGILQLCFTCLTTAAFPVNPIKDVWKLVSATESFIFFISQFLITWNCEFIMQLCEKVWIVRCKFSYFRDVTIPKL